MNNTLIQSTAFPDETLPINRWFRHICGKDLDLTEINEKTIIGSVTINAYPILPDETVRWLRDQAEDNPQMIEKAIGSNNFLKIK